VAPRDSARAAKAQRMRNWIIRIIALLIYGLLLATLVRTAVDGAREAHGLAATCVGVVIILVLSLVPYAMLAWVVHRIFQNRFVVRTTSILIYALVLTAWLERSAEGRHLGFVVIYTGLVGMLVTLFAPYAALIRVVNRLLPGSHQPGQPRTDYEIQRGSRRRKVALLAVLLVEIGGLSALYWMMTWLRPQTVVASNSPDALKVLFIGNSQTYMNDLPLMFARLTAVGNRAQQLKIVQVTYPAATLEDHWEKFEDARKAIREGGPWDYVVLQEHSALPTSNAEVMHRYVRLFDAEIKQAGARTVLYQTAAWRDYPETEPYVTWAYASIARELEAIHVPVGMVWAKVEERYPNLVLHKDDHQPNPAGTYLTACVFYAALLKQSPEGLPNQLKREGFFGIRSLWVRLPEEEAKTIQRLAWETVQEVEASSRSVQLTEPAPLDRNELLAHECLPPSTCSCECM
jgi:hypothetical protein